MIWNERHRRRLEDMADVSRIDVDDRDAINAALDEIARFTQGFDEWMALHPNAPWTDETRFRFWMDLAKRREAEVFRFQGELSDLVRERDELMLRLRAAEQEIRMLRHDLDALKQETP